MGHLTADFFIAVLVLVWTQSLVQGVASATGVAQSSFCTWPSILHASVAGQRCIDVNLFEAIARREMWAQSCRAECDDTLVWNEMIPVVRELLNAHMRVSRWIFEAPHVVCDLMDDVRRQLEPFVTSVGDNETIQGEEADRLSRATLLVEKLEEWSNAVNWTRLSTLHAFTKRMRIAFTPHFSSAAAWAAAFEDMSAVYADIMASPVIDSSLTVHAPLWHAILGLTHTNTTHYIKGLTNAVISSRRWPDVWRRPSAVVLRYARFPRVANCVSCEQAVAAVDRAPVALTKLCREMSAVVSCPPVMIFATFPQEEVRTSKVIVVPTLIAESTRMLIPVTGGSSEYHRRRTSILSLLQTPHAGRSFRRPHEVLHATRGSIAVFPLQPFPRTVVHTSLVVSFVEHLIDSDEAKIAFLTASEKAAINKRLQELIEREAELLQRKRISGVAPVANSSDSLSDGVGGGEESRDSDAATLTKHEDNETDAAIQNITATRNAMGVVLTVHDLVVRIVEACERSVRDSQLFSPAWDESKGGSENALHDAMRYAYYYSAPAPKVPLPRWTLIAARWLSELFPESQDWVLHFVLSAQRVACVCCSAVRWIPSRILFGAESVTGVAGALLLGNLWESACLLLTLIWMAMVAVSSRRRVSPPPPDD